MKRGLLVLATVLALAVPGHAAGNDLLLEDGGRLLAGTAGVGIGAPPQAVDDATARDLGPVSHAVHPFTVDCARGLSATATWTSDTNATHDVPEHALLQVELRGPNGTVHASSFDDDGRQKIGTDGMVEPGDHELHLFHLAGEPVEYHVEVEGLSSIHC